MEMRAKDNKKWNINGYVAKLETENIKPGESKKYTVKMRWVNGDANFGLLNNIASIENMETPAGFEEANLENNADDAAIIMTVSTGAEKVSAVVAILASYMLAILVTYVQLSRAEKKDESEE